MNKLKTLFLSIIIGLSVAAIAIAFTGPGSNPPPSGDPTFWRVSGSNVYYNVSGGNVGIGTATPNTQLQVTNSIYTGASSGAFTAQAATVYFGHSRKFISNSSGVVVDGSTDWLTFAQHSGAKGLAFGTSNTDATPHDGFNPRMVIQAGGNVGIGTTNPGAKLEVVGTVKMLGAWTTASTNTVYQAASDGFVIIHVIDETSSIVTDSANPPTVVRAWAAALVSGDRRGSATVPVRKGDYWKIVRNTGTGGTDVFWIPLGQ